MTQPELHDLAAAYALNALDPEDRWTYERHLDTCERCREEVASLREGAAQLAYAHDAPAPRPELRDRILRAAREERPAPVVQFPRWLFPVTAVAAVAASIAAIGLGLWANSLRDKQAPERVVAVNGARGALIVSGDEGKLVLCLDETPASKTYEAWVIQGKTPKPAGLFAGGCRTVTLTHPVQDGNTVAVTLENEGGSDTPHGDILATANV
ncbi:MAG TPA: anti-sigma factor [Gaiellaceae bacterium]|nr:anti-sigma factor [Gaiellaceae bacterium]